MSAKEPGSTEGAKSASTPKKLRRLPVLQSSNAATEPEEERTQLQWLLIGGFCVLLCWILLAGVVNAIFQRVAPDAYFGVALGNVLAYALAVAAGTWLLGYRAHVVAARGAQGVAAVTAVLGIAMSVASSETALDVSWLLSTVILLLTALLAARVGFNLGRRRAVR